MNFEKSRVAFQRAKAGHGPCLYLSAAFRADLKEHGKYYPRNRLFQYIPRTNDWVAHDVLLYITALETAQFGAGTPEVMVALADKGEAFFKDSQKGRTEMISHPDPFVPEHRELGLGRGIAQIGDHLYASGFDGQLVCRERPGEWDLLTPGLITNWRAKGKAMNDAIDNNNDDWLAAFDVALSPQWKEDPRTSFHNVAGPSEHEVYVTGNDGGLLFWDGSTHRWIEPTPKVPLFGMYVEPPNIWVCGSQGTILHGNAHDGFDDYSLGTDHSFNKIIRFKGKIYLSANGGFGGPVGLFTYDGHKLEQVSCGLTPDIHDIHTVTAADGILWAVGYRDILCFDGKTWQRIDHPDNPPVR